MILVFVFLAACVLPAGAIARLLENSILLPSEKKAVETKFNDWWATARDLSSHEFAFAFARLVNAAIDRTFGVDLRSKATFRRIWAYSALFCLVLCVALRISGHGDAGIQPRTNFQSTVSIYRMTIEKSLATPLKSGETPAVAAAAISTRAMYKKMLPLVIVLDSPVWSNVYGFFAMLLALLLSGFACALCFRLSRSILREVIAVSRPQSTKWLLLGHLWILLVASSALLVGLTILAQPAAWFAVFLAALFTRLSFYWLWLFVLTGGLAAWAFGSASLKLMVLVSMAPLVASACLLVITLIARRWRNLFHRTALWFLLRCVKIGPFTFIGGLLGIAGALLGGAEFIVIRLFHHGQ